MKKLIFSLGLILALAGNVIAQTSPTVRVDSLTALVALPIPTSAGSFSAIVTGNAAAGDSYLASVFSYVAGSSAATNTFSVFKPTSTTGRWIKVTDNGWNQYTAATAADSSTYSFRIYRNLGTNVFTIGADNNNAYIQSQSSYALHLNNIGNDTVLNATAGNVGVGANTPAAKFEVESSAAAVLIDENGNTTALDIDSEATSADSINVDAISTSGTVVDINVVPGGASTAIALDVASATSTGNLVFLNQDGNGVALNIDTEATTADAVAILTPAQTSGHIIDVTANALTSGSIALLSSDSADVTARNLVNIIQDNAAATGAVGLRVQQDGAGDALVVLDGAAEALVVQGDGGVAVGASGTPVAGIYSAVAQLDFPSIPIGTSTNLQLAVPNTTTNSAVFVSWASGTDPGAGTNLVLSASVESAGIVVVKAFNADNSAAVDATAAGVRAVVFQY